MKTTYDVSAESLVTIIIIVGIAIATFSQLFPMLVRFSFNVGVMNLVRYIWLHYMYIFAVLYLTLLMRFSQNSGIMTPMYKYPGFQEGELTEGQLCRVGRWTTSTMISDLGVTRSGVRTDYVQDVVPPNELVLYIKFYYGRSTWMQYVWDLVFLNSLFV